MRLPPLLARFVVIVVIIAALLPAVTTAATDDIPQDVAEQFNAAARGAQVEGQSGQVELVVVRMINGALALVGVTLIAFLVYAGWLYLTAGGEEEKTTKAKTIIRNAIIGLIILLLAYAISRAVVFTLLKATANVR